MGSCSSERQRRSISGQNVVSTWTMSSGHRAVPVVVVVLVVVAVAVAVAVAVVVAVVVVVVVVVAVEPGWDPWQTAARRADVPPAVTSRERMERFTGILYSSSLS